MLLFNPTDSYIETKFDGQIQGFKPFQKRRVNDGHEGIHVIFKLAPYGLVELTDDTEHASAEIGDKILDPFVIKGLKERRKTLTKVVLNFRTMNKEREAAKLSASQPEQNIIEAVKSIKSIDNTLKELNADDYNMVKDFLDDNESEEAQKGVDELDHSIDEDGKIVATKPKAKKKSSPKTKKAKQPA